MKEIQVKKGEIIQVKGDLDTKIYTVKKGLLRSYSIDKKGKEHIFLFASENWIMAENLQKHEPAELFIDALEDSELIVINKDMSQEFDLLKILKRMNALQKRVIMLLSYPAIERYEYFIETYPEIVQRVPQRMIASYLGVTPEALSKVKKAYILNQ